MNFYIPGLRRRVKLSAHIALWVAEQSGAQTMDELYLAYLEFRESGLELDHGCENPSCRNPLHLEPMTHQQNIDLRESRRAARRMAKPIPVAEDEPLPF